jgi:hypothetical protein
VIRPVLLPLLLLPVQWIGRLTGDWEQTLLFSHAAVLLLNCGFIYASMRLIAPRTWWGFALAVSLLCVNILFVDYGIFVVADLLSACCFVLAWLAWEDWLAGSSQRAWTRFVVWNGIGLLSKHTFPALWMAYPLGALVSRGIPVRRAESHHTRSRETHTPPPRHLVAQFSLMLIAAVLFMVFVTWWGGHNAGIITVKLPPDASAREKAMGFLFEFTAAAENFLGRYAGSFLFHLGSAKYPREWTEGSSSTDANKLMYVQSYLIVMGLPVIAFACAEGIRSFLVPPSHTRARVGLVLWTLFAFSMLITHKEVRYVTYIFPFVIALCVELFEDMLQKAYDSIRGRMPALCVSAVLFVLLASVPASRGFNEWLRLLTEPVFHQNPLHGLTRQEYRKHKGFYILERNRSAIPGVDYARFVVGWSVLSYLEAVLPDKGETTLRAKPKSPGQ